MTVENGWYVGNMTVVNMRGSKLPATGSKGTVILTGAGIVYVLQVLCIKEKRKRINKGK